MLALVLSSCASEPRRTAPSPSPAPPPSSSSPAPVPAASEMSASPDVGALSTRDVYAVLQANRPQIRRCASDANQQGRVTIAFTIAPKGAVTSAASEDVAGFDAAVVACMVRVVRSLRFQEATSETNVRFPMIVAH